MIDRMAVGDIPAKPHTIHRRDGVLRHEHCLTRVGFDGPFTIAHRLHAPHVQLAWRRYEAGHPKAERATGDHLLLRRHYVSERLAAAADTTPLNARIPLLFSDDVVMGVAQPTRSDDVYFENGDADDLFYIHAGHGTLVTMLGDVAFEAGDYLFIPRGLTHRFDLPVGVPQLWFTIEARRDVHIPRQFRNDIGQLRMDAPYTHRDFKRPVFAGPRDEGLRTVVAKREDRFTAFEMPESPLDVIGWDGTVWPWAFPIRNFQPKTSSVHLPPTIHGTFAIGGGLVCSFVPRVVDWHPEAIPCPYPHASVHCDEVIFYCEGNFTSRKGVGPTSISWHPMGTSHGPHPGAYERSIGHKATTEMAVMLDVFKPLHATAFADTIEDPDYHRSFIP
jgi:homogentisate 1,2-dioxygenase